MDSNI